MDNKKDLQNSSESDESKSGQKDDERVKTQSTKIHIPRPGIVVHPDAPQRLNVEGEPIVGTCCG